MTNDLEKQFFDTFGIEPKTTYSCYEYYTSERNIDIWGEYCTKYFEDGGECDNCDKNASIQEYPQITDSILLELEAIIHNEYNVLVYEKFMDSIKITAYPMDDNLPCDPAYFTVMAQADNKREALLVLAMDINVQHYIKQQVQALFEEG